MASEDASDCGTPSGSVDGPNFVTPDSKTSDGDLKGTFIKDPNENDVLCGRGGSINSHPGNERFRTLVEKRKRVYLTARFKREKRLIASSIVTEIRTLSPPGHFLTRDTKTGLWIDIGDEKARDKTSQALRENAPTIRAEIETEINEQRAEMQREEDEHAAPPVGTHPPPPYYSGWGYHSYYGYTHHAPPPPPPSHPHHHHHPPPPPPPPHAAAYHPGHYEGHWGRPPYQGYAAYPPPPPPPPGEKPAPGIADYIVSGAESVVSWTKSLGGTASHNDVGIDSSRSAGSANSKPISYMHADDSKKRRMVKFRDDDNDRRKTRPCYSPVQSNNSLVDGMADDDMEPQGIDTADDQVASGLIARVADQILGSIGSWEGGTICGHESTDDHVQFQMPRGGSVKSEYSQPVARREDMTVEWEGQEVQLMEKKDQESVASDERMPPPVVRRPVPDSTASASVAFSSLGSCHSWLPEQFGSAASYFNLSRNGDGGGSMDMDAAHEHSLMGSLGGGSLGRVFEGEEPSSPHMNHRTLNQVPSWERSLRSKSPLSLVGSDESLMSKGSSKVSVSSPMPPPSPTHNSNSEEMMWTKE